MRTGVGVQRSTGRACGHGVARRGQPAFAHGEEAVHQHVAVFREIGVVEAERVAHLVQDGGQEVHAARRCAGRIGVAARAADVARKLRIVHGVRVDEPALAGGSRVHADDLIAGFAEMQVAERRHFKAQAAQASRLVGRQAGSVPAGERGGDDGIEVGLGEIRLDWSRRGLRIAGRLLEPVAVQREQIARSVDVQAAIDRELPIGRLHAARHGGQEERRVIVGDEGAREAAIGGGAVAGVHHHRLVGFGCGIAGRNDLYLRRRPARQESDSAESVAAV